MKRLILLLSITALSAACAKEERNTEPAPEQHAEQAEQAAARVEAPGTPGGDPAEKPAQSDLGQAPDFTLEDLDGKEVSLSQHRGKTVVLEWFNPGCPFVQHAHGKGPLKGMGERMAQQGVVWLAINSGAPGKQGAGVDTNKKAAGDWNIRYPILLDESGEVGKAYGAKTTPHMYVINAEGKLVYRGGLDNAPMGEVRGDSRINYLEDALAALAAGKPIEPAEAQPYGCSVKYAD
jgi:peroxiredoxin